MEYISWNMSWNYIHDPIVLYCVVAAGCRTYYGTVYKFDPNSVSVAAKGPKSHSAWSQPKRPPTLAAFFCCPMRRHTSRAKTSQANFCIPLPGRAVSMGMGQDSTAPKMAIEVWCVEKPSAIRFLGFPKQWVQNRCFNR